eukprot:Rmarinus@m.18388
MDFDAVVVGAGVMGSAAAYYMSKRGCSVLLLEQFEFLHSLGSSHGASRIIRPTYVQSHYSGFMKDAYRLWEEIESESNVNLFTKTGGVDLAKADNPNLRAVITACTEHGIQHEVLSPTEAAARFPPLRLPEGFVAVYNPESGILDASKACEVMQSLAKSHGAVLRGNCKVIDIRHVGDAVEVSLDGGDVITCRKCVVTVGAWAKKLLPKVASDMIGKRFSHLKPESITVGFYKIDPSSPFLSQYSSEKFPVFISYEGESAEGLPGYLYGFPSFEKPGHLKICNHYGPHCDPDDRSRLEFGPVDMQNIQRTLQPFIRDFLTDVDYSVPVETVKCMYTNTPDEDFVIDFLPDTDRHIVIGCGFSGHGFKMGPFVGSVLADLAVDGETKFDISMLSLMRESLNP